MAFGNALFSVLPHEHVLALAMYTVFIHVHYHCYQDTISCVCPRSIILHMYTSHAFTKKRAPMLLYETIVFSNENLPTRDIPPNHNTRA